MRHLGGFILGIIAVPIVLYGTGWGYARTRGLAVGASPASTPELLGYAALGGVGLLIGLILATRVSPLAAFLPAAALLAWTGALFWDAQRASGWAPGGAAGSGMSALLASGVYGLLGVALLLPLLMPRRWRRREEDAGDGTFFN
ncbi:MAG TPA: hypothetical protein VGL93_32715 [Streptosporangiaceae bacterium]